MRIQVKGGTFRILIAEPVALPARVAKLTIRVSGTGHRDRLIFILRDGLGLEQKVPLGFVDFREVRTLEADVGQLPQMVLLEKKGLIFVGFYLIPSDPLRDCQITVGDLSAFIQDPYVLENDPFRRD